MMCPHDFEPHQCEICYEKHLAWEDSQYERMKENPMHEKANKRVKDFLDKIVEARSRKAPTLKKMEQKACEHRTAGKKKKDASIPQSA